MFTIYVMDKEEQELERMYNGLTGDFCEFATKEEAESEMKYLIKRDREEEFFNQYKVVAL